MAIRDAVRTMVNDRLLAATPYRLTTQGLQRRPDWTIACARGRSPFDLEPARQVLETVPGLRTKFVADPFLAHDAGQWHMFFEAQGFARVGVIAHAHSRDGMLWQATGVALQEEFHLSYPLVVREGDGWWMIPEARHSGAVRLYHADPFPSRWRHHADLLPYGLADPTVFQHGGRWRMFATERGERDRLRLFCSDELTTGWEEHPCSPVTESPDPARCGGRPFVIDGRLWRIAQDGRLRYGERLLAIEVVALTDTQYLEGETRVLREPGGARWDRFGTHHLDTAEGVDGMIAVVDGAGPARWRW